MVLLVDTNVILDFILKREPFYDDANAVLTLCSKSDNVGLIALHSVTNIFYILRKMPDELRRRKLSDICCILEVVGTSHSEVISAIENSAFKDFEDCIQTKCAKTARADYIISRNKSDFLLSEVPVLTPQEFIANYH